MSTEALYRNKLHRVHEVGPGDIIQLEAGGVITEAPLGDSTLIIDPDETDVQYAAHVEKLARAKMAELPVGSTYEGESCWGCLNYIRHVDTHGCILCQRTRVSLRLVKREKGL